MRLVTGEGYASLSLLQEKYYSKPARTEGYDGTVGAGWSIAGLATYILPKQSVLLLCGLRTRRARNKSYNITTLGALQPFNWMT